MPVRHNDSGDNCMFYGIITNSHLNNMLEIDAEGLTYICESILLMLEVLSSQPNNQSKRARWQRQRRPVLQSVDAAARLPVSVICEWKTTRASRTRQLTWKSTSDDEKRTGVGSPRPLCADTVKRRNVGRLSTCDPTEPNLFAYIL